MENRAGKGQGVSQESRVTNASQYRQAALKGKQFTHLTFLSYILVAHASRQEGRKRAESREEKTWCWAVPWLSQLFSATSPLLSAEREYFIPISIL